MKIDEKISKNTKFLPIKKIAKKLGLKKEEYELYGDYKAKLNLNRKINEFNYNILVTAMNPTESGEGKTTVAIGLHDAICKLYKNNGSMLVLREPSLGPVFGKKGGAVGGGKSQIGKLDDIDLHFTGDFHAISSANNLLSAIIDNHIFQGNELNIDPNRITWKRCIDMNDRSLRKGEHPFILTAATELMAILCLSKDFSDLKERISNICFGFSKDGERLYVRDLNIQGAICALLKDAFKVNLVQTLEGNGVLVHGGPFANISIGCSSQIAFKYASALRKIVITEAGFGSDLGAQKYLDILCNSYPYMTPNVAVLVCTVKSLKQYGNGNIDDGLDNLNHHINVLKNYYKIPVVVAINKFENDTKNELDYIENNISAPTELCECWSKGSKGAINLAKLVLEQVNNQFNESICSCGNFSIFDKVDKIVNNVYGSKVKYDNDIIDDIKKLDLEEELNDFQVCIAKTPYSLYSEIDSNNEKIVHITDYDVWTGAKLIVLKAGNILTMPGLSKVPNAVSIEIDNDGTIKGLF